MTKPLVIAGTSDSAAFLNALPVDMEAVATTFSQMGASCIPPRSGLQIYTGALDQNGFEALIRTSGITHVVDTSHPFAVEVSRNARAAAQASGIPYLRYARPASEQEEGVCRRFPNFPAVIAALKKVEGNIFLTVGSRNLHYFMALPDFHQRCYLRVLNDSRVLRQLEELGIDPAHVFAMKGVATVELNIAIARQFEAQVIVSKDSGAAGGVPEKMEAARRLGIPLFLITQPDTEGNSYACFDEILSILGRSV